MKKYTAWILFVYGVILLQVSVNDATLVKDFKDWNCSLCKKVDIENSEVKEVNPQMSVVFIKDFKDGYSSFSHCKKIDTENSEVKEANPQVSVNDAIGIKDLNCSHCEKIDTKNSEVKENTTVNMTENFQDSVNETNIKFHQKFSAQEVLKVIQENLSVVDEFSPGTYMTAAPTAIHEHCEPKGDPLHTYPKGTKLTITQIMQNESGTRIRGQLKNGYWVSIKNLQTGRLWFNGFKKISLPERSKLEETNQLVETVEKINLQEEKETNFLKELELEEKNRLLDFQKETDFLEELELEEKNRLLETVKKMKENDTKILAPIEKLHTDDLYKIMEFLGVHQVFSPFVRTNKRIHQFLQKIINENTEMFFLKLLRIPMKPTMIKVLSKYCQENPESSNIFGSNFFSLWNELAGYFELELLTAPLFLVNDLVSLPVLWNYYDYSNHTFIKKNIKIPDVSMFYHFDFPEEKLDIWFRIDHALEIKDTDNDEIVQYCIKFYRDHFYIELQKLRFSDKAYKIKVSNHNLPKEPYLIKSKDIHAEISNTTAFFIGKNFYLHKKEI